MPEDHKKFFKATLVVGICTFLSNILGLLRSTLISAIYGATAGAGLADCYTAAFKLPNVIYTLVASGIISIVLIPYFLNVLNEKNWDELNRACSGFINVFLVFVSVCVLAAIIFAEPLVKHLLVVGWTNEANIKLTTDMSRIILLQVFFFTLSSVFGSYLNALEKFTAYAFAMLSYNVGIIVGILVFARFIGITGIAWGVVAGGFFHFAIQLGGSIKNGFRYSPVFPVLDRNLKTMTLNGLPRIVTLGVEQVARFVLVNISSFLMLGSILIFDNVENISLVPYGLIAMSISTTAFPIFIKYYNERDFNGLYDSLFSKIRMLLFFILPVCAFMFIFRKEIVDVLVGYHNYGKTDVAITANALGYYVLGIPFFSITLVTVKFYYAQVKSLIPMFIAIGSVALTLCLCYFFSKSMGVAGLSLGRSIGYFLQAVILGIVLFMFIRKLSLGSSLSMAPLTDILKIALLCGVLFAAGIIFETYISFSAIFKLNAIIKMAVCFTVFAALYFIVTYLLRIPEARLLIKRKIRA
jgi:putative peptidoglycan lipid II flippase